MLTSLPQAPVFATLIQNLRRLIGDHGNRRRVYGPLLIMVWARLNRMLRLFTTIETRLRAGKLVTRPSHSRTGHSHTGHPRTGPRRYGPPRPPPWMPPDMEMPKPPGGFGWLQKMIPETNMAAGQLCALLQQPELRALFAEAPQLGKILRPLSQMLGLKLTVLGAELLPGLELPKRPRKPRERKPKPVRPARPGSTIRLGAGQNWQRPCLLWPTRALALKFDAKVRV